MIVTLTPNPSIDRTITLSEPLVRGGVIRSTTGHDDPGGKGVNVAQVVRNAGRRGRGAAGQPRRSPARAAA